MPRGKEDFERIKDERRAQIEQAAIKVFASKGLAAAKISDIAAEAGMSLGLIYHYFARKEDLFDLLVRRAIEGSLLLLDEVLAKELPAWEKLQALYGFIIRGIVYNPQAYMMIVQAVINEATSPELREVIFNQSRRYKTAFQELIQQGQLEGRVVDTPPEQMTEFLFTFFQGLAMSYAYYGAENVKHLKAETVLGLIFKPKN